MTEFELQQLMADTSAAIDGQFQFWITATFAVVVASYTAGARLSRWVRVSLAVLYLMAVAMFYLRWFASASDLLEQGRMAIEMGATFGPAAHGPLARIIGTLRQIVMFAGSVFATVMILRPATIDPKNVVEGP